MKAVTFQGVADVKVEDVADPTIVDPTDVVVRITTSAVCGSDLTPLLPLVERKKLQPARIITHTMPLKDTPHGYAIFDRKEDRAIKVMLKP